MNEGAIIDPQIETSYPPVPDTIIELAGILGHKAPDEIHPLSNKTAGDETTRSYVFIEKNTDTGEAVISNSPPIIEIIDNPEKNLTSLIIAPYTEAINPKRQEIEELLTQELGYTLQVAAGYTEDGGTVFTRPLDWTPDTSTSE
jgi:hypothetical protein